MKGSRKEELQEEIKKIIKNLDEVNNNSGMQLFKNFCNDFSISYKKNNLSKIDIENFKIYVKKRIGIILKDDNEEKRYSLENLPRYLLINESAPSGTLCSIKGLYKSIGETELLENINININYTDKIALIGRNGTGKTTLFKMIYGIDNPDRGEIKKPKNIKIGYLGQDFNFNNETLKLKDEMETVFPEITKDIKRLEKIGEEMNEGKKDIFKLIDEQSRIIERLNMNDGYKNYEMQNEILKYFGFTEAHLELSVNQLSGGEKTKIQIAKFILQKADILLLDEPTNHLDIEGIIFLESFLKKRQKGIICITHDKKFINSVFQNIWEISEKQILEYRGDYEEYLEEKYKNAELQNKKYEEQEEFIEKQKEFINKNRARKSKVGAVKSRMRKIEKLEKITKPVDEKRIKNIKIDIKESIPQNVITLNNVDIGYKDKKLFTIENEIKIEKNDKIGIIGNNGVGKTTLLKSIMGEIGVIRGKIEINNKIKIGYYSQIAEELNPNNTIFCELGLLGTANDNEIRKILSGLLIFGDKIEQKISSLSGGERSKIALAKMILQNPHVLIMDEPTNHLDIYSKEAIKNMLIEFPGVALIVSHDRDLLEDISNKIWLIKNQKLKVFDDITNAFKKL